MDQGFKHFSHSHNLITHQMPEGIEVSCSGCNSSTTGTVYVCWQCNFFLHEQCYRATRSLKHPSHPPHPLTLVPYPTYQSNSFYCNSCQIIGTGFSYSCADCEFDLHVQCAYSITRATSFKKAHQFQELLPSEWNGVHTSIPGTQDHCIPPNSDSRAQYHSTSQDPSMELAHNLASVSIHASSLNSLANAQYCTANHGLSVSIPTSYPPNPTPTAQNIPSVSIPTSSHNSSVQYPSMGQTKPFVSTPASTEYPSVAQTGPSVSIPTIYPPIPTPSTKDPSTPQKSRLSIPISSHNSSAQYTSMPQTEPSIPFPSNPSDSITSSHDLSMPHNNVKDNKIIHFSHPHSLSKVNLQEDEENEIICSGCEEALVGKGYSCVEPDCTFHLHESCFHLEKEIHHKSHPEHPLVLLSLAPYGNENGEFTCNACFSDGTSFTYHCSICKFDLHIQCVRLPETVKRDDHKHMLKLRYSCPLKDKDYMFFCDVCHGYVQKDRWVYYCEPCDYGTHLGCVDCEECNGHNILDTQSQLQMLELQMQMARQHAQLLASSTGIRY